MSIEELSGSELGTKEFWERSYDREIRNYKNNGDVGEIWFDQDSQDRVISWILKQDDIDASHSVIDLGCGNGMLLLELGAEGFTKLLGVDYSPKAVELANNIAKDNKVNIKYSVLDLLDTEAAQEFGEFDIVHDKGTYDAISLNPDCPKEKREAYIKSVNHLLKKEGVFIITSCNWTEEELVAGFEGTFKKTGHIPTPTFKFGGKVGSAVTSLIFKKI
uniref:Protein-lysine N-methyltransferase n=1 Tax=Megaselia scalaris TaxID=36166 RepID=T1GUJ9_MEGSC